MCDVLQVSPSGYYKWTGCSESHRACRDRALATHIRAVHKSSHGTYGSPRIHAELKEQGEEVSRKRIARLMRQEGLKAICRKRFCRTTNSKHDQPVAANELDRKFDVDTPDSAWATDMTYIWTWQGWLYLAVVIDLCSRRVVGWAAAEHMRTELTVDALQMAVTRRCPAPGLVHHSDRGSQYASDEYQKTLRRYGMVCSMSRTGNCWDNAVVESFFGTLKTELIHRQPWATRKSAREAIADYIELFYNTRRRHSHLGYLSPACYERTLIGDAAVAA